MSVLCVASVRSSSSSCTSSLAVEEEDSDISEPSDSAPPRPLPQRRHWGTGDTARRKPVLKPSTVERRPQYIPKSPKTVGREPPSSSTSGWRTRPQADTRRVTAETAASSTTASVFKVPKTQPSSRSRGGVDARTRIPRTAATGEDQAAVGSRPATAGVTEETKVVSPQLQTSSSDVALSVSGSSSRTQSRIPTRTGARPTQRDTGASSRGSSPGSVKWQLVKHNRAVVSSWQ